MRTWSKPFLEHLAENKRDSWCEVVYNIFTLYFKAAWRVWFLSTISCIGSSVSPQSMAVGALLMAAVHVSTNNSNLCAAPKAAAAPARTLPGRAPHWTRWSNPPHQPLVLHPLHQPPAWGAGAPPTVAQPLPPLLLRAARRLSTRTALTHGGVRFRDLAMAALHPWLCLL